MAKVSAKYETVFIINCELGEEAIAELVAKFKTLVEKNGTLVNVDEWGKRRLAYPINDETEGYYVFTTMTCEPSLPAELERIAGITEGVLRIMVIRK